MGTILILLLFVTVFLALVASYDSKHLKRRTYIHTTQQHRAISGRLS